MVLLRNVPSVPATTAAMVISCAHQVPIERHHQPISECPPEAGIGHSDNWSVEKSRCAGRCVNNDTTLKKKEKKVLDCSKGRACTANSFSPIGARQMWSSPLPWQMPSHQSTPHTETDADVMQRRNRKEEKGPPRKQTTQHTRRLSHSFWLRHWALESHCSFTCLCPLCGFILGFH